LPASLPRYDELIISANLMSPECYFWDSSRSCRRSDSPAKSSCHM